MIYVGEWYIGHVHGRVKMHRYLVEKNYYLYDESYFNVIDNWHYLKPKIEVHHIDFNHCNNDLSNLIPLSEGEHRSLHNKHRKQIRDSKTGKFKKSMKLNEYQQKALETAIYSKEFSIIYPALGMCGEAGEVADKVKKVIRDNNQEFTPEKKNEIAKEIGDVLWYCATLANDLGFTLEQIAEMNYEKLKSRQQRGKLNGSGDNR